MSHSLSGLSVFNLIIEPYNFVFNMQLTESAANNRKCIWRLPLSEEIWMLSAFKRIPWSAEDMRPVLAASKTLLCPHFSFRQWQQQTRLGPSMPPPPTAPSWLKGAQLAACPILAACCLCLWRWQFLRVSSGRPTAESCNEESLYLGHLLRWVERCHCNANRQ